ncbi:MAG TPA: exo-beta-N-acetylmuramidase NamZ domain-containing protein [Thermoanaerobaculia bacterium]|nr:exo-beta-N-acetylmuramidase NamZ domain-containing protein [Thermoanaerobaculia bacterium]
MRARPSILLPLTLPLVSLLAGCTAGLVPAAPPVHQTLRTPGRLDPPMLRAADAAIENAIEERNIVGGIFFIDSRGEQYGRSYGVRATTPRIEPISHDTIWDMASLTKVVATTPSIMLLVERALVEIDAPASRYLSELADPGITVRHLLTHTSGLRPSLSLAEPWSGYEEGIRRAVAEVPVNRPGHVFRYSDVNFILLGEIVRRVSGVPLDEFAAREIYRPLGMRDTGFRPPASKRGRIAPTEQVEGEGMLRGVVHDPTSRRMGGVAGHAGLFSTVDDLRRYAAMILGGGELDGLRLFQPETIDRMTGVGTPPNVAVRRSLGWDVESTFSRPRGDFPFGSFGHTGWTGPFIWIDPASDTFYLFLTNRVHPDGSGSVLALQEKLGELTSHAIVGADYAERAQPRRIPGTRGGSSQNGIDVLVAREFELLRGMRVGLITNHTGRDRGGNATIDLLRSAPGVDLRALFSPEHGIRGELDAKIDDGIDPVSGLPVYSLYGERRAPSTEQLAGLDVLVFDIQDIGARFYTYVSTMGLAMEAAAKAGVRFVVLDRVNPIAGTNVEGPATLVRESFTAYHPIAVRHGMTVGELARMFNAEKEIGVDLTVVPVAAWTRGRWFDQTGLPWIHTSPNIRNLDAATLYPGVCILERTRLSMGRGTPRPFEWVGAPWIDGGRLARELEAAGLAGIRFVPQRYTPDASLYEGEACDGVLMEILDRERLEVLELGALLATTLYRLHPEELGVEGIDVLLQHPPTIDAIRRGEGADPILELWAPSLEDFVERRAKYLMYE